MELEPEPDIEVDGVEDIDIEPDVPPTWEVINECTRQCDDSPYSWCPRCPEGLRCNASGRCVPIGAPLGSHCGPNEACTSATPGWPSCLGEQCTSGRCLRSSATFLILRGVCSQSCQLVDLDGDGVQDAEVPDDCADAVDGPAGSSFRCVGLGRIGESLSEELGTCAPGTSFAACERDGDCPADEGCELTNIGGGLSSRCIARYREGPSWDGTVVAPGARCDDARAYCETGLCFEPGCVTACVEDRDCASPGDVSWTCQPSPMPLPPETELKGSWCWPDDAR